MWHFRRMGMTRRSINEETNLLFMLGAPLKSKPKPSLSMLRSSVRRDTKLFIDLKNVVAIQWSFIHFTRLHVSHISQDVQLNVSARE